MNVAEICEQLKTALLQILEQNGQTKPIQILVNRIVDNVRRITRDVAENILRSIFYPYGTRTLDHPSQVCHKPLLSVLSYS